MAGPTIVTLFLKGSVILFAKKGQATGTAAILRSKPPRHKLKIDYFVKPPGGTFGPAQSVTPIRDALRLYVTNPNNPNITLRGEMVQINRDGPKTNTDSVKWFVDLENAEVYGGPIDVHGEAFKELLVFNSGELFSDDVLSKNRLLIQRGSNSDYQSFGFVTGKIGVKFRADSVLFSNGGAKVFDTAESAPNTEFKIELENDAAPASRLVTDANHYYKGVGTLIDDTERILFASIVDPDEQRLRLDQQVREMLAEATERGDRERQVLLEKLLALEPTPPAGPEAACFPAYMSRSNL